VVRRVLVAVLVSSAILVCASLLASDSLTSKAGSTPAGVGTHATTIFYGGRVVPMTSPSDVCEAIALDGERVLALGTDAEILALAGPETRLTDLQGRAVYPGFIDPHTHLMQFAASQGFTWDSIQEFAFENGVTSAAEMFCNPQMLNDLVSYASSGALRLRLSPYLIYNDSCGAVWGTWYEQYPPFAELAPRLRVGGVKLFSEGSLCGDRGIAPVFSPALLRNFPLNPSPDFRADELLLSREELTSAIRRAQEKGYPVAIHAIGDVGVETSLRAIIDALDGRPNTLRHLVMHNRFVRDDLLDLYAQYGITAMAEPISACWWTMWIPIVGARNGQFFGRQRDLVETGVHVSSDSDWPCLGQQALNPLRWLAVMLGVGELDLLREYEPCSARPTDQTLSAWQGLRMMTAEAAYALHIEDELGTLEPGKLADLVVLSANPLEVDPVAIGGIQVLLTMVDGVIEWRDGEFPAQQAAPKSPSETVRIVTFNAEWLFDGVGDAQWYNAPQSVAAADAHLRDVAEVLSRLDADYISLDEVEDLAMLECLAAAVGGGYEAVFVEGNHPTGQDTCALSRLPVSDRGRTWDQRAYPIAESLLDCSTGIAGAPMHYWCDVDIEDIPVTIIGAHFSAYPLDCGRCSQREAEAAIIRDLAKTALDRGREVIILGDLNDYDGVIVDRVGSLPISSVLEILKDIDPGRPGTELVNVAENLPQGDRYSCFWDQNLNGAYDAGEPFTQIDYILVSVGLAKYVASVRVDTSRGPGEVSDHWPIVVELTVPKTTGVAAPIATAGEGNKQDSGGRTKLLFDESHDEFNTLSATRANVINPEHPEWYLFAELLSALQETGYDVERGTQWPDELDPATCDALIIAVPGDDFTETERAAIARFVDSGGGLLLLADSHPTPALVDLAAGLGIQFAGPVACSSTPDWDPESFWAPAGNSDHPVTQGTEPFHTNWGCVIEGDGPGVVLVRSDQNTWLNEDDDGAMDSRERRGPFTLALALERGAGRVVAIADNAFHDGMFGFPGNRSLILNAIAWLAHRTPGDS
jgi:predicted amidohydrolase YtcJ/endonuclease/exonuclease/phosphatase family metal-dependent hydrolase